MTEKDRRVITRFAFWCALVMLAIIPVQIAVFSIWPMPTTAMEWIAMFDVHPFASVLHLDLLNIINIALISVIYLGLFAMLIRDQQGLALLALVVGLVGVATYFPTVQALEIREMARHYHESSDPAFREGVHAVVDGMLAIWQGTAFVTYYVLNALSLLVFSIAMFRSSAFGRTISSVGFVTAMLWMVPASFGTIGLVFSLLSLIPWIVFLLMLAPKLLRSSAYPPASDSGSNLP